MMLAFFIPLVFSPSLSDLLAELEWILLLPLLLLQLRKLRLEFAQIRPNILPEAVRYPFQKFITHGKG